MSGPPIVLVAGQATSRYIQCNMLSVNAATGAVSPALYNATDTLSAKVIGSGTTGAVFAPPVEFFTNMSTQSGYGQGQVEVDFSAANMALLQPTSRYTIDVWRAIVGVTDPELIARRPLVIEPLAIP